MSETSFRTIDVSQGGGVDVELEIRRSRFLTRLRRVSTENAARAVVEERRSAHFDARHHCSAFVLGVDGRTARSSDDGEPAGTAGLPMLQVLQKNALTDVVAVVTRYFGGIKLGAGGLVRAYSDAVAAAVEAVGIREVRLSRLLRVDVDYAEAGAYENQLRGLILPSGLTVVVDGVEWTDRAHITVAVEAGGESDFAAVLATISGGSLTAAPAGERWMG
ncbi:YigZ family protein [Tessaracoccus sp. MC1679]|uniref:IMPACT family protein n=1 Tax=Tessaracoccus sp. MC1679 TaxID=2760313 RepID=UPI0016033ADD|nr:YigZ family protein [Tessaracoccus sp. MC1679]